MYSNIVICARDQMTSYFSLSLFDDEKINVKLPVYFINVKVKIEL